MVSLLDCRSHFTASPEVPGQSRAVCGRYNGLKRPYITLCGMVSRDTGPFFTRFIMAYRVIPQHLGMLKVTSTDSYFGLFRKPQRPFYAVNKEPFRVLLFSCSQQASQHPIFPVA